MFRRAVQISTQHSRNLNLISRVGVTQTRNVTKSFRDELVEGDKWSKDKMEIPFETAGKTPGVKLATELFRHAYNKEQLGLYYLASKEMLVYIKEHGIPRVLAGNTEFFDAMYKMGIPDEISQDLLPHMVDTRIRSEARVLFKTFIEYYNAHFNFQPSGKLVHGAKYMPTKYNLFLNNNLVAAVCGSSSITPQRVIFHQEIDPSLLGGYNIQVGNMIELHSKLNALSKMKEHIWKERDEIV